MAWPVNARTSLMMDAAQALYGATITATQGSPSFSVGASAGTHDGEGVIDVVGADLDAIVIAMRQVGFAAWHRTTAQGFTPHVHGVAIGEPLLSPEAAQQVDSYIAGYNGLRGNGVDDGPRDWVGITWETYSGGTYIPPTGGGGGGGGTPVSVGAQYPGDRSGTIGRTPGGTLAGTPTYSTSGSFHPFFYADFATEPAPQTLSMSPGDSVMLALAEDWTFIPSDPIERARWIIRYTGSGTLTVSDAYDEGYNYPSVTPTWTAQTSAGVAGGLAYFSADPTLLDEDHLYLEGQPLVRLVCAGAAVAITFVGLQLESPSGYYQPDGGSTWSGTAPASTFEPADDPFGGTFGRYTVGDTEFWVVDDTEVLKVAPIGTDPGYDAWQGEGESTVSSDLARAASLADFHPFSTFGVTESSADLYHVPVGFMDPFEHWLAELQERVRFYTSPTKAELPATTPEYQALPGWMKLLDGTGFDWIDDVTDFEGWRSHDGNYTFEGDGDTFTVYLHPVPGGFDTSTEWLDDAAGFEVFSSTSETIPPFPVGDGAINIPAPEAIYGTASRLVGRRIALSRRLTAQESFYTEENGYPSAVSGTFMTADEENRITARFRQPAWRYEIPTFTSVPGPPPDIDFDEDLPLVNWLRQRQRNDGLGNSVIRARGSSSRQMSLRQRGYR